MVADTAGAGTGYTGFASWGGGAGMASSVAGAAMQAVGAYYGVKASQYQAKSQALDLEFQRTMAGINARAAEQQAQDALREGQRAAGRVGLQYKQVKAALEARRSASGVQAGVGSAAEAGASVDYAAQTDMIQVNRNAVRMANDARLQATNLRNQGLLAGVSASNVRRSASSMSPALATVTSLLGSSTNIASQYARSTRDARTYSKDR